MQQSYIYIQYIQHIYIYLKLTYNNNTMRFFLILLFISAITYAQSETKKQSLNEGTIDEQFEFVLKKSSNYQEYKVVKKTMMYTLKSHVIDSLKKEKNDLIKLKDSLKKMEQEYLELQEELQSVNANLKAVTSSKDTIKLLGIPLKREVYKSILWSLIGILFFALMYFIYIFNNSNVITQKAIADYNELENEFNNSKTRALEREQVLNRKLQDEINKQKKS